MKTAVFLGLLVWSALLPISGFAQAVGTSTRVCVLSFERDPSPIGKATRGLFAKAPATLLITEAVPTDLLRCLEAKAEEIVMVVHAFKGEKTNLGYFKRGTEPGSYVPLLFYDRAFALAHETLKRQERAGTRRTRRIRMMVCDPPAILAAYPSLLRLIEENRVEFETAPRSAVLSWLEGTEVTAFNVEWLARSIDCWSLKSWRTPSNRWCESDGWPGCNRAEARFCAPRP